MAENNNLVFGKVVIDNLRISKNRRIKEIFVTKDKFEPWMNKFKYNIVDYKYLDNLTQDANHQKIAALVSDFQYRELNQLDFANSSRILILDSINDPQNFGAILRSCEAFGYTDIIIPKRNSVKITPVVTKIATGATEFLNIYQVSNLVNAINQIKKEGFWVASADANTKMTIKHVDSTLKWAVIIGSEGKGIGKLIQKNSDVIVKIPMKGKITSLNASVSAGIIMSWI